MRAAPPLHPIPIKEASFNNSRYRKLQLVKNTKNNWQWGTHPQQGIHLQYNIPITKTGNIEEDGV